MKNIWNQHKIKMIVLLYALLCIIFVYEAVLPMLKRIRTKSDAIQEKIIDNQINQSRLDKIPEMEADYETFQKNKEVLGVILEESGEVDFIKSLEILARDTGNGITLKIKDNPVSGNQKSKGRSDNKNQEKSIEEKLTYDNYISMQIQLKGGYMNLINFMKKLENDSYYVNVISLESKKTTESIEEQNQPSATSSLGVFSPSASILDQTTTKEKDILSSVLNVVVYIKK